MARMTQILSAMSAVCLSCSAKYTPSSLVFTVPSGPRYSIGTRSLGSNDSWAAMPPGRKILITDLARAAPEAGCAWSLNTSARLSPRLPIRPTKRNSRRLGRQIWSVPPQKESQEVFIQAAQYVLLYPSRHKPGKATGFVSLVRRVRNFQWLDRLELLPIIGSNNTETSCDLALC